MLFPRVNAAQTHPAVPPGPVAALRLAGGETENSAPPTHAGSPVDPSFQGRFRARVKTFFPSSLPSR
jgi:hypothetical protein